MKHESKKDCPACEARLVQANAAIRKANKNYTTEKRRAAALKGIKNAKKK